MPNQQADGSIIVDTRIDDTGFTAGSAELKRAVKSLNTAVEGLGPTFQKALSGNASAISSFNAKSTTLEDKIADIESKMEQLGSSRVPTDDFTWLTTEIGKAEKELEKLEEKQAKMEAMGVKENSRQWENLQYDIDLTKQKLAEYKNDLSHLESSGQAYKMGSDTDEYARLEAELNRAKGALAGMTSEAEHFETASKGGTEQMSRGKRFASAIGTAMSKVAGVVKNGVLKNLKSVHKTADGLHKKLLKMGFAMLGMRGLMGGIRQIVSSALNNNEQLQNQLNAVKGVLGQAIAPIISVLVRGLATLVTFADRLYSIFTGISLIAKFNAKQTAKTSSGLGSAAKNAKKLTRQLAGFDELNVLSKDNNDSSGGGGGGATSFEPATLSKEMQDFIDQFKELWEKGDFYGIGALVSSKIVEALQGINWDDIKKKAFKGGKSFAELLNGLFEYSDADGNTLMSSIGKTIGEGLNTVVSLVDGFAANLHWNSLGSELSHGIDAILKAIDWKLLFKTAIDLGTGFGDFINGIFEYKDKDGNSLAKNLGTGLTNAIHTAFLAVTGFVKTVKWDSIGKSIADFIQGVDWVSLFAELGGFISVALKGVLDLAIGFLEGMDWGQAVIDLFNCVATFFANIDWTGLADRLFRLLGDLVGAAASLLVQYFVQIFRNYCNLGQLIKDYFDKYIKDAKDSGGSVVDGIKQGILDGFKKIGTWIKEHIFDPFINGFKNSFGIHSPSTKMAEMGGYIIDGLKNGIGDVWNKIKEKFTALWTSLKGWFDGKVESFKNLGSNLINKIKTGIGSVWSTIKEKFTSFWTNLSSWFSGKAASLQNLGKNMISKIKTGVGNVWNTIKEKFTTFWTNLSSWFSGKATSLQNLGKNIISGIKTGINNKIGEIKTALTNGLSSALTAVKKLLGIHSPSRVFRDEVGQFIALGVGDGITGNISSVVKDAAKLAGAVSEEFKAADYQISSPHGIDIGSSIDTRILARLESIANGMNFNLPAAISVLPYKLKSDNTENRIDSKIEKFVDELINANIQIANNQTAELRAVIEALNLNVSVDAKSTTSEVIAEINRRIRVTGSNPLLT